ncbi:uncharacterized protein PAN0_018d5634 [Moesziomyces antarcticus]|uniref:Small RNA 2'-O-methyltransferase n=1 Tax=Pseudozyma antarctica TaxID=84753 RepID=A0A081CL61_PSEA2|nr:uncharacterized protein PAN0_018d5634 [Moesziomyces antarcticus]GAK67407.1 conserved hypothetical protein [Moesziomyces antarcticus]
MVAKIYFDPPLWLQRQSWVLGQLRQQRSDSVVDVGCSNGVLLSALMQPAFQLDQFPVHRFPALALPAKSNSSANNATADDAANNALLSSRHWIYSPNDIVLNRLIGIDVERNVLDNAKSSLSLHGLALAKNGPRWKSLDVRLFLGPVQTENETLDDYDAFVATEVIEHLDESALQQFAPTVFGKYRPRIVLITTPNYCFNDNFGQDLSTRPGFLDPTGRTDRVFRHEDHKFEFTPQEFANYCHTIADDFGYEVSIKGIGAGIYRVPKDQMDPPVPPEQGGKIWKAARPRTTSNADERLRYATQTAIFVRHSAAASRAAERSEDAERGAHVQSSHPFSDRFLQSRSAPKPPVETRLHDIYDEAISRDDDENEEDGDERGRSGRRARSRRAENLPFLSSPSPQTPLLGSVVEQLQAQQLDAGSAPTTPFSGHQLVWSHRYDCSLPQGQVAETGKRQLQTAVPMAEDEIVARIVEKQRQLYVHAQWHGDEGADARAGEEAVSKLWDVWSDDDVRAACAGRVNVLLDALHLVAPDAAESSTRPTGLPVPSTGDGSDRRSVVVGSDARCWELRVQTVHHQNVASSASSDFVESDLWLAYTHADVARWQAAVDEASHWVPRDFAARRHTRRTSTTNGKPEDTSIKPLRNAASHNPSWD